MRTRPRLLGAASILILLTAGCVSRSDRPAGGTPSATTTVGTSTTFSAPPASVEPTPDVLAEVTALVRGQDAAGFNARICSNTTEIQPVPAIGPEYAGAEGVMIGSVGFVTTDDRIAAVLSVPPGPARLLIGLGIEYTTGAWCAYRTMWCPVDNLGMAPFLGSEEYPALREVEQRAVCPDIP